jgi:hypothetical protein
MSVKQLLSDNIKFHFDGRKGSFLDQSESSLDLTLTGTPIWKETDRGGALQFDGSTAYLENTTANWQSTDSLGTFACWIKLNSTGSYQYIFSSCDTAGTSNYFALFVSNAEQIGVTQRNADTQTIISGSTTLEVDKWYHVVLASNGTSYEFYVNGVRETESSSGGDGDWLADTDDRDSLALGAFVRSTVTYGDLSVREIVYFDTLLTASQVADLYSEASQEPFIGAFHKKEFQIPPIVTGGETDAVAAYSLNFIGGLVNDLTGAGNGMTRVGGMFTTEGVDGAAIRFDGTTGYLNKTVANFRSSDSAGSIEAWVTLHTTGSNQFAIFASSDTGSTTRYLAFFLNSNNQLAVQQRNADTTDTIRGAATFPVKWPVHCRVESNGTAYKLFLNNTAESLTVAGGLNTGDWFADTPLRDNITIGALIRSSSNLFANFIIHNVLVRSSVPPSSEVEACYLLGAGKLTYKNDFSDYPVTIASSVGSGEIGGFHIGTGTWKISEDGDGKWLECVSAGYVWISSFQPYGTWEWDLNKSETGLVYVLFIADTKGIETATGQDGYNLLVNSAEQVILREATNGSGANLMLAASGTATVGTSQTYRVTRSPAGVFRVYLNGTLVTASSGSNPVTDTTVGGSNYVVLDMDAGDKIRNFKFRVGDVTPSQIP